MTATQNPRKFFVQRRDRSRGDLETVDEFTTRREAVEMCDEYRLSDPAGVYYISSRACRGWEQADV